MWKWRLWYVTSTSFMHVINEPLTGKPGSIPGSLGGGGISGGGSLGHSGSGCSGKGCGTIPGTHKYLPEEFSFFNYF